MAFLASCRRRSPGGDRPGRRGRRHGHTAEALNLLVRRNLLFKIVPAPSAQYRVNVKLGTPEFPAEQAADPSAFALKVRRQLTDEQRTCASSAPRS